MIADDVPMSEEHLIADLRAQMGRFAHVDEPQEQSLHLGFLIPKDPYYPADAVQCDDCGGTGCQLCEHKGWFRGADDPRGRKCACHECRAPLHPARVAVYCSVSCALMDR